MEYDATGNEFELAIGTGEDARRMLQEVVDLGADYWRTRSRRRTGFNATHVVGYVDPGEGRQYGVVYAYGHYARYREHGTRYNAAEHVMADFLHVIEEL
ncbi:hypothetical protein [Nocardia transvalensis]|uniref:hypothetical protein n=1 Tax=Nocardia transvalensis TaxID=37333 RepID=UPI001893B67B|nr:hypothetical protein [Nocardia transvalensis]MBF6333326.1 hypothetical protein [Nocardia transvalensis]